jgi:hypothetical protein
MAIFVRSMFLALVVLAGAVPGARAAEGYIGQWRCQMANQSVSGNRFENFIYDYVMALQPDGSFFAQGTYLAETNGFSDPFQAQGQWNKVPGGITGTGQAYKQTGNLPFGFQLIDYGSGGLSYRAQSAYGKYAIACRR